MKYHAPTEGFIIDRKSLEFVAMSIPYIIKQIRLSAGLPLDKYEMENGLLSDADHAMRGVLEIADKLGIEVGARWGNELDVRKAG